MKRLIALFLILLLSLSLFAGCAKNGGESESAPPASEEESASADSSDETETAEPHVDTPLEAAVKSVSSYTVADVAADDARLDTVVAKCGDYELTNRQLQFYYRMEYMNFMSQYGMYAQYFGLDASQPLSEQPSMSEGMSWEQFFLYSALENFHQSAAVSMKAKQDAHEMSEDTEGYLTNLPNELETQAAANGFASALAYVQDAFGSAVAVEDYVEYARFFSFVTSYENEVYRDLRFTDEEIEAYFDANADSFEAAGVTKDNTEQTIDIRHILIMPEDADGDGTSTEEEWAAAREAAEAILDEYKENATESNFAALANTHSQDPGSNQNGGLYEMVRPGQMVQAFNDWCFDEERLVGDTDIVETEYGYHIMYFVGRNASPYWKMYVLANGLRRDRMQSLITELSEAYEIEVTADQIILTDIPVAG